MRFPWQEKRIYSMLIFVSTPPNFVAALTRRSSNSGALYHNQYFTKRERIPANRGAGLFQPFRDLLTMNEFIAFRAANWARTKGRETCSLPSCLATHCGARVALQHCPILRVSRIIVSPQKIEPYFG